MPEIMIRPADPTRDFARLAELFTSFETSPSTEEGLLTWYHKHIEGRFPLIVAATEGEPPIGVACLQRRGDPADGILTCDVIVDEARRCQGVGGRLYAEMEQAARTLGAKKLYAAAHDDDPQGLAFAEHRGFAVRSQGVEMRFNLDLLDERRYDPQITALKGEGFDFTSMAELGDSPEARLKLYHLNSSAAMTTPGADGRNPWADFADFNTSVCESDWYCAAGQIIAIEAHTGTWAGMSAITRVPGADHAYNLFTGVQPDYRGRGLGQAVKVQALKFARANFDVHEVRTNHNAKNLPMIAIDLKLGYEFVSGMYGLQKALA